MRLRTINICIGTAAIGLVLTVSAMYFLVNPTTYLNKLPGKIRSAKVVHCVSTMHWPRWVSVAISDKDTLNKLADALYFRSAIRSVPIDVAYSSSRVTFLTIELETGESIQLSMYSEERFEFVMASVPFYRRFSVDLPSREFDEVIRNYIDASAKNGANHSTQPLVRST